MSSDQTAAVEVFFSYSHRDEGLRDKLETHLASFERQGAIRTWHDRRVGAGCERQAEIDRRLESADLILLLISPDSVGSNRCDQETRRALERHDAGEARVVPVILRPTDWQATDFARLQVLPRNGQAIIAWRHRDQAFVDVVRDLRAVIAELRATDDSGPRTRSPRPADADDAPRELAESLEAAYQRKTEVATAAVSPEERTYQQDGSELIYVPSGAFLQGANSLEGFSEEVQQQSKPEHTVWSSAFWIGKYPVTNQQYGRFLSATGHRAPALWNDERFNAPPQPVVGVSWLDASVYCNWAGLALPTEAQWEAAARGTDGRLYPWGHEAPTDELADFNKNWNTDRPDPVGSHPRGKGPFGTEDQAGGVWEWCADKFDARAYRNRDGQTDPVRELRDPTHEAAARVLRGGAWSDPSGSLRAAFRFWDKAGNRYQFVGFRGCRSG